MPLIATNHSLNLRNVVSVRSVPRGKKGRTSHIVDNEQKDVGSERKEISSSLKRQDSFVGSAKTEKQPASIKMKFDTSNRRTTTDERCSEEIRKLANCDPGTKCNAQTRSLAFFEEYHCTIAASCRYP